MKIIVNSPDEKAIKLVFPTKLIFNRFTACIGAKTVSKYVAADNIQLKPRDLYRFMKEINRLKRKNPDLVLVDVQSSDGDTVLITL